MENHIFSKNKTYVKDLLNKLLNEKLAIRIKNLELNNNQELSILSSLSTSSKQIENNLYLCSNSITNQEKKEIIIPKLKFEEVNKVQNKPKKNIAELDGILKNNNYKNKRNKEKPISNIINNEAKTTRVSFWQNDFKGTPDRTNKTKHFMTNIASHKKESKINKTFANNESNNTFNNKKKKTKIKNIKCLTERTNKEAPKTPLRLTLHQKLLKKTKNYTRNYNTNLNNDNISLNMPRLIKKEHKNKKILNKTTINVYEKKNKNNIIGMHTTKTPEKIKLRNEMMKNEMNLKSLCESMLIDVDKDELLVNNDKIIPEFFYKNEENKTKKFEDKLKTCIQYFSQYLTFGEIFQLMRTKKEIMKIILNILINQTEKSIDNINSTLKNININNNELILTKKLKPFEFSQNSQKAISLLNSISKISFIKSIKSFTMNNDTNKNKNNNIKKILLIYDIYFISIGKKKFLNNLNMDNNKKIEYICNYFKNSKSKLLGNIIETDLKNKKFDDIIINHLYEYSKEYIDIINPNYYKKINKDIAIFVFIIKNILDFVGISFINNKLDNKNNEQKIASIYKSRLNVKNNILDKLNQILNKFDL